MAAEVLIKEYTGLAEYQLDVPVMAAQGWRIVSAMQEEQHSGCLRIFTLGLFSFVWKPKPRILVTDSR
jgi:hypothetical protein